MQNHPYIFIGMPGYGEQTNGAGRGFWRATRRPDSHVTHQGVTGSLLAQNFNRLWCTALNLVHQGQRVDYFAMQHSDIEPDDFWLDTLIEELEAKDLDVLGVPAPIKDPRGVTSLALDRPDGDTWSPLCRLTMREIHSLPETFTSADTGHPLLLNTGLWVCRFDPEWTRKVYFTINDRIVFDRRANRYVPQVEPEDWFFSRLLHEQNLKIGATRKVSLNHRGPANFPNARPWGEEFDSMYCRESQLPKTWFPRDVAGWLTITEGEALRDLAQGKRVLEIGSYCGRSTICLAAEAEEVVSIDPHDGRGTPHPRDTFSEFLDNLERYGCQNKVVALRGTSEGLKLGQRFGLVFIDGAHDADSVRGDIRVALDNLEPGGLIAFHDYHDVDPGVVVAVDELLAEGGQLLKTHDSLAVVKPPAQVPMEV